MKSFLDTAPLSIDELPSTDEAITSLKKHIDAYRATINDEGVWLFLSTVGCLGVPSKWNLQIAAFGLSAYIFGERIASRYAARKSFSKLASSLETRIQGSNSKPEDRTRQLLEISEIRRNRLTLWRTLFGARMFLACYVFYWVSFYNVI